MRTLKVQGRGWVQTEPDIIFISFRVEAESIVYEAAVTELNRRAAKLKQSFVENNIPECELKTTDFGIDTRHSYKDGKYIFGGYSARHSLRIEVPNDKDKLNALLRSIAASESGAEIRISFSVKDTASLKEKVLERAVADAKSKAAVLAAAAGVQLGEVVTIDYGWSEVRIYNDSNAMEYASCADSCAPDVDIEPEDVCADDTVTMVYAID